MRADGPIVFDAYGTLFDFNAAARRAVAGDQGLALARLWRTKQIEYTWHRSLTGHYQPFWTVTGEALDFALAELGLAQIPDLRDRLMTLYRALDPFPDAAETLDRLAAAGRPLAILSNGSPEMLAAVVAYAGWTGRFQALLSVDAVKIFKPHPAAYRIASDHFGLPPAAIQFVSANGWDCSGAAAFGFQTIKVARDRAEPERLPGAIAATVTALAQIPALVGVS